MRKPRRCTRRIAFRSRASSPTALDENRRALDLGLFINGLPVVTFELKNRLTKQTVEDAVEQYKHDRDPRERLFSFITLNWRGKLLHTYQTVVNLIAATTTQMGLEVQCELDSSGYEKGRKVTDAEMNTVKLRPHRFHGEWNYTIEPH